MLKVIGIIFVLIVAFVAGFFLFTMNRSVFWPMRIVGGNPGNYMDGDYVLVESQKTFNPSLEKGDIVIFKAPRYDLDKKMIGFEETESVGELIGKEDDSVNETTAYYNDESVKNQVPKEHVLIRLNDGFYWRVVPNESVIGKVIYPKL